ncbi:MAG: glycerophosphodiester phosphodiesterase, partial [Mycoplasma sp.]|nr:glycerophosphodiester phosphodiesterase [Mycoplasma sp.]
FREKGVRENRYIDFEWALKVCKAVEFDVRLNGDNEIVIFHDNDFKRIGNNSLKVRKATQKDIDHIFKTNKDWKPTLFNDYIDNLSDKYEWINVEIKPNRYTEQEYQIFKEALLKLRKKTKAEIVVSSFSKNDLNFIAT